MNRKTKNRLDAFFLSLGSISIASPYVGLPIVSSHHIARAWDEKLKEDSAREETHFSADSRQLGWIG